jgi:hypothetical protein
MSNSGGGFSKVQPRLKTSKKWTAFPKEYADQILGVYRENFAEMIGERKLILERRIYATEVVLRVGYLEPGRLKQANFEVSMDYSPKEKDAVERIHNCVDAAASMLLEYFDNEGVVDFPLKWESFPFQKRTLFLKYSTENTELEAEANKLLGVQENSLLLEDEDTDDALAHAEIDEELSGGEELAKDVLGTKGLEKPEAGAEEPDDSVDEDEDPDEDESEDPGPRMFGGPKSKKTRLH